jgi:heptosyltransferase-1
MNERHQNRHQVDSASRRILIIRLSAIGDVVMATPLIQALRDRYPEAYLAWLVQPEAQALLSANPGLDEVVVWPRNDWWRLWSRGQWLKLTREVRAFVAHLRSRRFDTVIDAQGLLKSAVWARWSGAPTRIGLGSREGSGRLMTRVVGTPSNDKHLGAEYRHLLRVLGFEKANFPMDIALNPEDRAFAQAFLKREGLQQGYAVLCPFTTRPQKHWVEIRWPALARRLQQELALPVVILGGPGDVEAARRLVCHDPTPFINMTGKTTLREAAALIAQASLLIGVDTALSHMGTAFLVPTVILFGSTCPYLETDSDNTVVVYRGLACSPCKRRPRCGGSFDCMGQISVDEVMRHAHQLRAKG